MTTYENLIGREDINDLEAILSVVNTDRDELIRSVEDHSDAIFTWDYEGRPPAARKLYEKARSRSERETDYRDTEVDIEQVLVNNFVQNSADRQSFADFDVVGTPFEKWDEKQWMGSP